MTDEKVQEAEVIEDARTGEIIPRGSPPELKPGILAQININQVGTLDVSEENLAVLSEPLDSKDVLIRPDGLVYLPWTWYAKRLNRAFGALKWGLVPQGAPQIKDVGNTVLVVWLHWLVVKGVPVSMAGGETSYQPSNYTMSYGDAVEGARSNSLARNCKYMGMALELWDAAWVANWKKQYAETYEDRGKTKWRKKGIKAAPKPAATATKPVDDHQKASEPQEQTGTSETTTSVVEIAQNEAQGYLPKDLKMAERVVEIKTHSKAEIPAIMKVINGLDKNKKYTVGQVVKMLTGDKHEG